uniref:Uncharacterized protein n=1 Tax=Plectus sambesii TaxID=2011161 RepID=A0A914V7M6_9BILA
MQSIYVSSLSEARVNQSVSGRAMFEFGSVMEFQMASFFMATAIFASAQDLTFNFSSCSNQSSADRFVLRSTLWKQDNAFFTVDFLPNDRLNVGNQLMQWRPNALNVITFSSDLSADKSLSLQVNDDRVELDRHMNLSEARLRLQINEHIGGCVQFSDSRVALDEHSADAINEDGFSCVHSHHAPCGTCRGSLEGLSPVASVGVRRIWANLSTPRPSPRSAAAARRRTETSVVVVDGPPCVKIYLDQRPRAPPALSPLCERAVGRIDGRIEIGSD